jgi:hypothetical protein
MKLIIRWHGIKKGLNAISGQGFGGCSGGGRVRARIRILGLTPCDRSLGGSLSGFWRCTIANKCVLLIVNIDPLRNRGVKCLLCLASRG